MSHAAMTLKAEKLKAAMDQELYAAELAPLVEKVQHRQASPPLFDTNCSASPPPSAEVLA